MEAGPDLQVSLSSLSKLWPERGSRRSGRFFNLGFERLEFFTLAHQPGAVKHHKKGTEVVHDGGHDGVHITKGRESEANYDEGDTEEEVLVDHAAGAAREAHQERQALQVVVHERD